MVRTIDLRVCGIAIGLLACTAPMLRAEEMAPPMDVDALDLKANPKRFSGKWIRVQGFHCYAADKQDYRCINPDVGVSVAAIFVTPDAAQASFDAQCATIRAAASSPECARPFVFKVIGWKEDASDPAKPLLILPAGHIEVQ